MTLTRVCCALLLVCGPLFIGAQLVGTPPNCNSYRWDNKPVPKEVYKCESFSELLEIADAKAAMTDQYFQNLKSATHLRFKDNQFETAAKFPSLTAVGTLEVQNNLQLQYLRFPALETADSIIMKNMSKLITFELGGIKTVKTFDYWFCGNSNLTLGALTTVERMMVLNNPGLKDLRLNALQSANLVFIKGNGALMNVQLQSLKAVDTSFAITDNRQLSSISLQSLSTVGAFLSLQDNGRLSAVDLPELVSADALAIQRNPLLTGISAAKLTQLNNVQPFALQIRENPELTTVTMKALKTLGGISIGANDQLTVTRFDSLETVVKSFQLEAAAMRYLSGFNKLKVAAIDTNCQLSVPQICCGVAAVFLTNIGSAADPVQCKYC